jgi:hypothetical protein
MAAFRPQDREFTGALLDRCLVDAGLLVERIRTVEGTSPATLAKAAAWVEDRAKAGPGTAG